MRLENKVIIVTGSTTGIGKAIAIRCVKEGAKVVIHGLEEDWGKSVIDELGDGNAVLHIEDLSVEGATQRLVDLALKSFGKLDAIVNNAAIVASSNIQTTDKTFLQKIFAVNTIAPFQLIKDALPHLSKQRGCVLNIGSVNAWCGEPNLLAYSMSKGALDDDDKEPGRHITSGKSRSCKPNQSRLGFNGIRKATKKRTWLV